MGFMKWLARRGNVGGAARWAANGYKFFRLRHPDKAECPDSDIFRLMIASRFQVLPNPTSEEFLLSLVPNLAGLFGLVVAILSVEAGYMENTPENRKMFQEIVVEELDGQGIPSEVIFGPRSQLLA
jgi:hypothetical protein